MSSLPRKRIYGLKTGLSASIFPPTTAQKVRHKG
jgi:hypothetical protein